MYELITTATIPTNLIATARARRAQAKNKNFPRGKELKGLITIAMMPIDLVVIPQLFCQGIFLSPFSSSNSIPNMRPKFCPSWCDVAAWAI
jgi:hypothetical protein